MSASTRAVVLVTGKGPLKEQFEAKVATAGMQKVSVKTVWLRAEDYPVLLGAADLGVCLHYSSSGLDLPMKVPLTSSPCLFSLPHFIPKSHPPLPHSLHLLIPPSSLQYPAHPPLPAYPPSLPTPPPLTPHVACAIPPLPSVPWQVVDMFGCGLPVCAVKYSCIGELVDHGKTGMLFKDSEGLAEQLRDLLGDYPRRQKALESMGQNVARIQGRRWEGEWEECAKPLLEGMLRPKKR